MNKQDLMREMSEKTGITKRDCGTLIDCLSSIIVDGLKNDDYVKLPRLGVLYPVFQSSRPGRNPRNGRECVIKERISTKLKVSKYLIEALNSKKEEGER